MAMLAEVGAVETLAQAVVLFERVGMPARNLSLRTRTEYSNDLADVVAYLERGGITKLAKISLHHLTGYQAEMDRRGYKSTTRNRKTYAIKSFFQFLHTQGIIRDNIARRLIPPRANRPEPRFLSEAEYQRLLRTCCHHPRDAAIIEVFLQTGMRLSELARLTLDDIELPNRISRDPDNTGSVRVTRKRGKTDTIPLNYKACQALVAWLNVRPRITADALFVTKFRGPMGMRAIQKVVEKYVAEAGIRHASVHTLRHTMAAHHAARGTALKTIQDTLGHESLTTTTIYLALAKKTQRKALQEHAL